ncbi:hypothetical protein MKJ01_17565 [Chryseobacterium sp. SSA4.19]|uniref:hypothetical protein n=1 Tax=Chryseobacterium sp. SSA4.19 TaxID=2919915 RepID=UPI001F4E62B3|nr:hypothetical protein [Chryseobacterium sp. SSA4.19]MCJ8155568.1 hypothetical protein [Chryseobacterium sp. SSA4.19]
MAKLSYYFPLDNLVNNEIINNYKSQVQAIVENSNPEVDFDEEKGSYLNFKDNGKLELTFKKTVSKAGTLINFFFNYDKKNNNGAISLIAVGEKILSVIKSNSRNAISFKNSIKTNDEDFRIRENHWFNGSLYFNDAGGLDLYMTDENFLLYRKALISVDNSTEDLNINIGGNNEGDQLRIADLSIYGEVAKDEVENIINKTIAQRLTLLSKSTLIDTVTFKLTNSAEYDKLVIENVQQPLSFEFSPGDMMLEQSDQCVAKLKAKKGFFKYKGAESSETTDSEEFSISFDVKNQQAGNNLTAVLEGLSIINGLNQERVLVQLEIYNVTLTKDDFSKTYTQSQPLIIDRVFELVDLQGAKQSPFDVFILGNDTLYNGAGSETQTIRILINNTTDEDLKFSDSSGFRISGNFRTILENDVQQASDMTLKEFQSFRDIATRPKSADNDFLCFQDEYVLAKRESVVFEISGLKARQPTPANPSGAYPFYLEYRHISGYRDGKVRFFLKTGKIFYSL